MTGRAEGRMGEWAENSRPFAASPFRPFVIFFLLLNFLSSNGFSQPLSQGAGFDDYQKGLQAMKEGSPEEAEPFFQKAVTLEPMNPEYHFELANLYAMRHDDSYQLGDDLGAQRNMQQAAHELQQAVMVKPDFLAAHFNLGVVYKKLGKYEDARKEFKEVLRLDPSQASAHMQIGATYEEQGFLDEAEIIYQEIRETYPYNPEIQDALNGLEQRRLQDRKQQMMEQGMRMNSLSNGLSAMRSQTASPYGAVNDYQPQGSGAMQQALPMLGTWALQQFMKGKKPASNQ